MTKLTELYEDLAIIILRTIHMLYYKPNVVLDKDDGLMNNGVAEEVKKKP